VHTVNDSEFRGFQKLVHDEAGIFLSAAKKALLVGRLSRRLRELDLESFADYYARVASDPAERIRMLDALCTHETQFFREPQQWAFLESRVYPAWHAAAALGSRPRRIRAWSAACSSGEEPYSLAMSLLASFPAEQGWSIEIAASDLSTKILSRAEAAVWPMEKAAAIPDVLRRRFMLRGVGSQEGRMKAGPEIRSVVRFARVNLNAESYPLAGPFDLILCRNVLIYFDARSKGDVIRRLLSRLGPGGLLLLGHAETLAGVDGVRSVGPTAYVRTGS
jgi:chemotaxis protein methyltransferase CheR